MKILVLFVPESGGNGQKNVFFSLFVLCYEKSFFVYILATLFVNEMNDQVYSSYLKSSLIYVYSLNVLHFAFDI